MVLVVVGFAHVAVTGVCAFAVAAPVITFDSGSAIVIASAPAAASRAPLPSRAPPSSLLPSPLALFWMLPLLSSSPMGSPSPPMSPSPISLQLCVRLPPCCLLVFAALPSSSMSGARLHLLAPVSAERAPQPFGFSLVISSASPLGGGMGGWSVLLFFCWSSSGSCSFRCKPWMGRVSASG